MNIRILALIIALFPASMGAQTLRELKSKYLNKEVEILPTLSLIQPQTGGFAEIFFVANKKKAKKGVYTNSYKTLPLSYLGKPALVVAIRLEAPFGTEASGSTRKVNAIGESVADDDRNLEGKNIEAVLRFQDGTFVLHSELYSSQIIHSQPKFEDIQLLSERRKHAKEFAKDYPSILGRDLYIPGYASVYPIDTTLKQMEGLQGIIHEIKSDDLPLLTPAKIVEAKYLKPYDLVVMKLRLVDGRQVLVANRFREESSHLLRDGLSVTDDSTLGRISGNLLLSIPPSLTAREVNAIQNHQIFKGMGKTALFYLLGRPGKTNVEGNESQLVYRQTEFGGATFIYLDSEGKVVHWQVSQ